MLKRTLCTLLALCLLLTPLSASDSFAGGAAGSTYPQAGPVPHQSEPMEKETKSPDPAAFGIDVSAYQGAIDWETTAQYIDFAILRCGYGRDVANQDDSRWFRNADACTRLGIPFGVYLYSYAESDAQAVSEAQHVIRLLEGYSPSLPVYLDLEDGPTVGRQSNEDILRHAKLFCDAIAEAGYTPGIYASYYWWNERLTAPEYDEWSRWLAVWSDSTHGFDRPFDVWQYGDSGSVPGIDGPVDVDRWYADLPTPDGGSIVTIPPTCTEVGCTVRITAAGVQSVSRYVGALGHTYQDGACIRCAQPEPAPCEGGEGCPGSAFADLPAPGHWSHAGIDYAIERGLMQGLSADTFAPDGTVSRAQLVTILYRAAGSPEVGQEAAFSDVAPGQWYTQAVAWAAENGIVNGVGAGRFDPNGPITREQLAAILYRCTAKVWVCGDLRAYPDGAKASTYAVNGLVWATSEGIVNGISREGTAYLAPQSNATRAQIASIIMRYLEKFASMPDA